MVQSELKKQREPYTRSDNYEELCEECEKEESIGAS